MTIIKRKLELFIKCDKCNYKNARIRKRLADTKCPNCGFQRELTEKEIEEANSLFC